jgi:hypothetical protein
LESNDTRGAPRYHFIVDINLTDLKSRIKIETRTKNLSVSGCGLDALELFPRGTKVRIELSHADNHMVTDARIVYSSPTSGMGVIFIGVEPTDKQIIDGWIIELTSLI